MSKPRKESSRKGSQLLGRELRLRRGRRSYAEMARLSNSPPLAGRVRPVSESLLHKLESGKRLPSVETLRTLSFLYGLTVEHMFRLLESERLAETEPEGKTAAELMEEANLSMELGEYQRAFVAALRGLELAEDSEWRARFVHAKASAMWKLGLPREAATEVQETLADPTLTDVQVCKFYYLLAGIFRSLWNLRLAERFARAGMEIARRDPSSAAYAALLRLLGNVLSDQAEGMEEGDGEKGKLCREALQHYEKAARIFEDQDMADQLAATLASMGVAHRLEGNRILAFEKIRAGLELSLRIRNRRASTFARKELGRTLLETGTTKEARSQLVKAERDAAASGFLDLQFQALYYLLECARQEGDSLDPLVNRARALLPFLEDRFPERRVFEETIGLARAAGESA